MEKLLYLVHRIPYPPNKGDKIRSFNFLRTLAQEYEIYLGAFVDDPEDWKYSEELNRYCREIKLLPLDSRRAKLHSLKGFLSGAPLTLPYYTNQEMQRWVEQVTIEQGIDRVLVFSSAMAQFVEAKRFSSCCRVIDFVDADSDKWRQYAESKQWPMSWVYRREWQTLLDYERRVAKLFDSSLFVSADEAASFRAMAPESADKIGFVNNGVDSDYFSPQHTLDNPYSTDCLPIAFTGAMDYWANVDAVVWFAEEVFPELREQHPQAMFYIVGSDPTSQVEALAEIPGIEVTGRVEDVRPYIHHAKAVIAPMRIARGIQNKVLEAMAMARPVVTSAAGLEGIQCEVGVALLQADTPAGYLSALEGIFADEIDQEMGDKARQCVRANYSWQASGEALNHAFTTGISETS